MEYALEERIGNPDLFVGRKKELGYFMKWLDNVEKKLSKSTAILARRKMGKTALMERLFNIIFHRNGRIIPFYYEVKETEQWVGDFCVDFFLSFVYQYIAFKTRNTSYLSPTEKNDFDAIMEITRKEGFEDMTGLVKSVRYSYTHENIDILWNTVREAPKTIAARSGEFIVQMIDEFQYLNALTYWDKEKKRKADTLAGGYLSTAESKIAPLIVSGSWVGWLMDMLIMTLPARFKYTYPANLPQNEAVEMIYKYSEYYNEPVTEETGVLIAELSEGSPFYISSILRSDYENKDLTTVDGLVNTLEFETLNDRGEIKSTWMEYMWKAFSQVNDKNAKNIVLYLSKHREREVTRKELLEKLSLNMSDSDLEKKLEALVKADIINQGRTNFDYRGVRDNIFEKVFRGVYQKEIEHFDPGQIKTEYEAKFEELQKNYRQLQGKYNFQKGVFAEYVILDQLTTHAVTKNDDLKLVTFNLPEDFNFAVYENAWTYRTAVVHSKGLSVDILARAKNQGDYSIIGEVKKRDSKKFTLSEAEAFLHKFEIIKEKESLSPVIGFVFSMNGFTKDASAFLSKNGIAYSQHESWLDT